MTTGPPLGPIMDMRTSCIENLLRERQTRPVGIVHLGILGNPYRVLISTILSLKTKDNVMEEASGRIFAIAPDLESLDCRSEEEILKAIYPVGFYRTKARTIKQLAKNVREQRGGKIPERLEELLTLPGVGLKTANLVISAGFGGEALCVDTHVHRIVNRWGLVRTKNPDDSFRAIDPHIPGSLKPRINPAFVAFGQSVCLPVSPRCSLCPFDGSCAKLLVRHSR